jgi:hypothetical protein
VTDVPVQFLVFPTTKSAVEKRLFDRYQGLFVASRPDMTSSLTLPSRSIVPDEHDRVTVKQRSKDRHTILVIGGYGFFGERICKALTQIEGIRVMAGGRNAVRASERAKRLGLEPS